MRDLRWWSVGCVICASIAGASSTASAQGDLIGIGPRVTFQRGDADVPGSSALRLLGGQLKLRLSPKTAIELSADYKSSLNASLTERVKSLPLQASLLVFPVRASVSPYVLGGVGWYSQTSTQVVPGPTQFASTSLREMGYHVGVGAEVRAGKHIAVHGDYRYTHIRFGGSESDATSVATVLPLISRLTAIQEALRLSHQGSSINWGVTFYF